MVGRAPALWLAGAILFAPALSAQTPTKGGSIRGIVYDSLLVKGPLPNATVELVELGKAVTTDRAGIFRFDAIPGGRYTVSFTHNSLSELGFSPPDRLVQLGEGIDVSLTLATPSGATIYRRLCPNVREGATGVVLGTLQSADPAGPVAGGEVRADWTVTTVSKESGFSTRPRVIRAPTDVNGRFQLCGVPNDVAVVLRGFTNGIEGPPLELQLDNQLVAVRHLTLDVGDSTSRRATVTGRVTTGGTPLAHAMVLVLGSDRMTRTDADGVFTLKNLPAGSQMVEARALGFKRRRLQVELSTTAPKSVELAVTKAPAAVELPELSVTASKVGRGGFEDRRRLAVGGYFITRDDIVKRGSVRAEDLFRTVPGIRLEPAGLSDYRILSTRGGSGFSAVCEPAVFIDNVRIPLDPGNGLSLPVIPEEIDGIEVHQSPNTAPIQYRSGEQNCGIILIWTRRGGR